MKRRTSGFSFLILTGLALLLIDQAAGMFLKPRIVSFF